MVILFVGLVLYLVTVAAVCAVAVVLGGPTERRVAIAFLIAAFLTQLVSLLGGTHWNGANHGVIVVDLAFAGWLIAVACRSERYWPLWAAASQVAGCFAHLPALLLPLFPKTLYLSTQPFWAFPLLGSLLVGTLANRVRTATA